MEVSELIVRAGWDGADLTRGLLKGATDVQAFGRHIVSLQGQFSNFKTPDTLVASAAFRSMGVAMKDVQREFAALGLEFDKTSNRFRNTGTGRFVSEVKGLEALSGVIQRLKADAQALAQVDAAIRSQIAVLVEGARMANTQAASLKELRTVYAQVSREIASSNPPLERRIQLERELVRIRQQFSAVTATSRAGSLTTDFAAAAIPAQQAAAALGNISTKAVAATRSFALINRATGEFTALGRRASGAAVGFGFGLEALARGGTAADGGLRTALRSVASFAAFFGPKGLVVAGASAATAAIIDLFKKSREEIEKTTQTFNEEIAKMVRGADVTGLMRELQKMEIGEVVFDEKSGLFKLSGGLNDLKKQKGELDAAFNRPFAQTSFAGVVRMKEAMRELDQQIAPLQARYDSLDNLIRNFPTLPKLPELPKAITISGKSDAAKLAEDFRLLKERVDETTRSAEQLRGKHAEERDIGVKLVALYDEVTGKLAQQKGLSGETVNGLRDMLAALKQFGEVQSTLLQREFPVIPKISVDPTQLKALFETNLARVRLFIPVIPVLGGVGSLITIIAGLPPLKVPVELELKVDPTGLANFGGLMKRVRDAQGLLDFSQLTGDTKFQKEAEESLAKAQQRVQDYARNIQIFMAAANVPLEAQRKIMAGIVELTGQMSAGAQSSNKLAENIHSITTAGRGLLQIADSMSVFDDNTRQALEGVLQLADAMALLKTGGLTGTLGGIVGLIGGAASLLQGLGVIGESPAEQERNRILRSNNEELARLRLELRGFGDSIGEQLGLASQIDTLQPAIDRFVAAREGLGVTSTGADVRAFGNAGAVLTADILKMGFSLEELAAIAKQSGQTILDAEGRLIPEAMEIWAEAIRVMAEQAIKYGDSFAEAREATSLLNRARGIADTHAQQIQDSTALFQQFSPKLWEEFFAGVDFTNVAAGRAAIDQFLTAWLAGLIPVEMFEGLKPEEIRAIISGWMDVWDAATKAVEGFTEAMLNVPAGYRVERARFEATLPFINPNLITNPWVPEMPGGPSPFPPGVVPIPGTGTSYTINGPFYITTQAQSAEVLYEDIKQVARRKGRALGGLNGRPSDALDS